MCGQSGVWWRNGSALLLCLTVRAKPPIRVVIYLPQPFRRITETLEPTDDLSAMTFPNQRDSKRPGGFPGASQRHR